MSVDSIIYNVKNGSNPDPDLQAMVDAFLSEKSKRQTLDNQMKAFKLWMRGVRGPIGDQALSILE